MTTRWTLRIVTAGMLSGVLSMTAVGFTEAPTPGGPREVAVGQSSYSNETKEAMVFFTKLAKDSDNPLISAWARESLSRLANPNASPVSASSGARRREVSVNLLAQSNNSLAVPVMLNRKSMGTFIVDTGASYTVITPRMARKLNVVIEPDTPRVSIITANGMVKAPLVTIDSLTIGEVEVKNVKALVQPLGNDLLLAGLLGMNFFQGMDMAVRQNKLILSVNE